ncbi:MAG: four helix bundle protein [Planctomycetaceae bacterium]|nr:four helix bundle protein [Planctomycetaceae bacterium]
MAVRNCRDLVVWQKAMKLAEEIYALSAGFPPDERFALTNQIRRAVVSIPSNVAEGEGRSSKQDFRRFLNIAMGSLREVETQLELAIRLRYASNENAKISLDLADEVGRMLRGLAKSLEAQD